jgi:hypothetical protein
LEPPFVERATLPAIEVFRLSRQCRVCSYLNQAYAYISHNDLCSVSLGSQGQIAYVAGNFFIETLASYRRARNLPGVCLQLGAWESKAVQNLDMEANQTRVMLNKDGIPLILKAMSMPIPVQLIVEFNVKNMAPVPAYAGDPLFSEVLPLAEVKEVRKEKPSLRKVDPEVGTKVISILRDILELRADDTLGTPFRSNLSSDLISKLDFAYFRDWRILNEFRC